MAKGSNMSAEICRKRKNRNLPIEEDAAASVGEGMLCLETLSPLKTLMHKLQRRKSGGKKKLLRIF